MMRLALRVMGKGKLLAGVTARRVTRVVILLLTLAGLAAAAWVVARGRRRAGARRDRADRLGRGSRCTALYSLVVLALLGAAWRAVAPGGGPVAAYAWARTVREGATDVLPFAQIGGLVVGGRVLAARGVRERPRLRVDDRRHDDRDGEPGAVHAVRRRRAGAWRSTAAFDGGGVLKLVLGGHGARPRAARRLRLRPAADAAARRGGSRRACCRRRSASFDAVAARLAAIYRAPRGARAVVRPQPRRVDRERARRVARAAADRGRRRRRGRCWRSRRWSSPSARSPSSSPARSACRRARTCSSRRCSGSIRGVAVALSLLKRARDLTIGLPALLAWQAGEGRKLLA